LGRRFIKIENGKEGGKDEEEKRKRWELSGLFGY
jgi:hypothetical protein